MGMGSNPISLPNFLRSVRLGARIADFRSVDMGSNPIPNAFCLHSLRDRMLDYGSKDTSSILVGGTIYIDKIQNDSFYK